ncbi:MAG TPA: methyltransferase domain-containing protein [Candidatus Polarisedimenticolia bacterium]|nr:methyltransferase domain-containing protein [Candidatus Polarisedimenticolia bacterium]
MWPAFVCPEDHEPLQAGSEGLDCPRGHRYRIEHGIPRFAPGPARQVGAFGLQWNVYRRTQLDSYSGLALSRDRARRCLGEVTWAHLHSGSGAQVLEVGCGAGRFTEILLATGAAVTSIDLSAAVEANQENFPQDERHRVVQADLLRLPFALGQYDVVFCLGVIQHTPSPERTIEALYRQVKPGGWLVIDHYTLTLSYLTQTAPLFRMVLRRLPPEQAMHATDRLVAFFLPLHRAVRGSRVAHALLSRVSPVRTYFHALPLDDDKQREWALLDTHDALTDWYKRFRTRDQIRRLLERLGGTEIWAEPGGNGVEARCRRPR